MKSEWIALTPVDAWLGDRGMNIVHTALRCRRQVVVRFDAEGKMQFFAQVPLPKKVSQAIERQRHPPVMRPVARA